MAVRTVHAWPASSCSNPDRNRFATNRASNCSTASPVRASSQSSQKHKLQERPRALPQRFVSQTTSLSKLNIRGSQVKFVQGFAVSRETLGPDKCCEILLSPPISKCDIALGPNHSISNHQFCAGRFDELSPLFAMRFAAQTVVYSKTCRMLFCTCARRVRDTAVESTRGRRFKSHNREDFRSIQL